MEVDMVEEKKEKNSLALASMIVGIISILVSCCCGLGIPFGSLAIIFAALSRVDKVMSTYAKAGLITGIVGLALSVLAIVFMIIMSVFAGGF